MKPHAAAGALLALCACAVAAAQPLAEYGAMSWAKPGVSYEEYRSDAIDCTAEGTLAVLPDQVSQQQGIPPGAGVVGAAAPGPVSGGPPEPDIHDIVANLRMQAFQAGMEARELRQAIVDECLFARGYAPFLLTDSQRQHLRTLARGTPARHRFLHSLATDPAVLEVQALRVDRS